MPSLGLLNWMVRPAY